MIFGNIGKMGEMLKQAKAMKDALSKVRCEGEVAGVKAVVNGEMDLIELKVPPEASSDSIKEAVNRALRSAKVEAAKLMQNLAGRELL